MQFRVTLLLETDDYDANMDDVQAILSDLLFDMDDYKVLKTAVKEVHNS